MTKEERRIIAEKHFNDMEREYVKTMTDYSQKNTIIYDNKEIYYNNDIVVYDCKTEEAVFKFGPVSDSICVLNFASFTKPGGGFIKGAIAQEEALCHASNLYNVLIAFKDKYDENFYKRSFETGLYENWAIFSPKVYFENDKNCTLVNVITCPAPNYKIYKKYYFNENFYLTVLKSRIKYILDIAQDQNQKILILGAFGCGVFGNDPTLVASIFKEFLKDYKFEKVIFAIPDNGNGNYVAFKKVFG